VQTRWRGLRAGARWDWLALAAVVAACNAPNSAGLYSPARPGTAGDGGAPSSVGGSSQDGGGSGSAGGPSGGGSAGGGGSSSGGAGAGGSPAGGTGGNDVDAGSIDAGVNADAGLDAGPACGGTLRDGICWYLGPVDQTCSQVCANRGGFNSAATSIVGTPAQGGSLDDCSALLQLLLGNADDAVVEGTQVAGNGVGCHLFDAQAGQRWWLTAPDFSPDDDLPGARVVCGCNQ